MFPLKPEQHHRQRTKGVTKQQDSHLRNPFIAIEIRRDDSLRGELTPKALSAAFSHRFFCILQTNSSR